jgi:hypothetical protein
MDLKEIYKRETGKEVNGNSIGIKVIISRDYVDWLEKQLRIGGVSQQRELLIAYEKNHYTPQEWALASKQCIEDIDNFLAINCG